MTGTLSIRKLIPFVVTILFLAACTNTGNLHNEPELELQATSNFERIPWISSDDIEESEDGSEVDLTSSDLEITRDSYNSRGQQKIGLRFTGIDVPKDATVTRAWLQFTVDEATSVSTVVGIRAIDQDDAPFFNTSTDLAGATKTSANVSWSIPAWNTVGESGAAQRSPDLKAIVQEVVDRPNWKSGNTIAFVLGYGYGKRVAESRDSGKDVAPRLYVEYSTGSTPSAAYQQDSDGLVQIEAENNQNNVAKNGQSWRSVSGSAAQGNEAMQALPDNGTNNSSNYTTNSPRLDYTVNFNRSGIHYVWVRGKPKSGPTSSSNSLHVGFNSNAVSSADNIDGGFDTAYTWVNETMGGPVATINVPSKGVHTVNVWMREDGFTLDALEISSSKSYTPGGTSAPTPTPTPTISTCLTSSNPTLPTDTTSLRLRNLSANAQVKLAGKTITGVPSENPTAVRLENNGSGLCVSGGTLKTDATDTSNWDNIFHGGRNFVSILGSKGAKIERVAGDTAGDALSIGSVRWVNGQKTAPASDHAENWALSHSYFRHTGDDILDNDMRAAGTIDNVLVDWTYVGIACRGYEYGFRRVPGKMTVKNTLFAMKPQASGYGGATNTYGFPFKWDEQSQLDANGTKPEHRKACPLALNNVTIYMAPKPSGPNSLFSSRGINPVDYVTECTNVTFLYGGSSYPHKAQLSKLQQKFGSNCFKVIEGSAAKAEWNTRRDKWFADHDKPGFEHIQAYRYSQPLKP